MWGGSNLLVGVCRNDRDTTIVAAKRIRLLGGSEKICHTRNLSIRVNRGCCINRDESFKS
jgi:hypothetical protein